MELMQSQAKLSSGSVPRQVFTSVILPLVFIAALCVAVEMTKGNQEVLVLPSNFSPGFNEVNRVEVDSTRFRSSREFKSSVADQTGTVLLQKGGLVEVTSNDASLNLIRRGLLEQDVVYFIEKVENIHGINDGLQPEHVLVARVTLCGPNGKFEFGQFEFDNESKVSYLTVFKPNGSVEFREARAKYDRQPPPGAKHQ